jgi:hypothetical protein
VTRSRPAFYAPTGSAGADLVALLHPPYTAWHLSYAAIGAALAPEVDWLRLAGTLAAFLVGTGIAAHALDEWHGRPLRTTLSDRALLAIAASGLAGALVLGVIGAFAISPVLLLWAAAGLALAVGYPLERPAVLHSDLGFAVAWGAFPVLTGYWAQAERVSVAALSVGVAAVLVSLAQRLLSRRARFVRRTATTAFATLEVGDGDAHWSREELLESWERPLELLSASMVVLAIGLLAARV